MKDPSWALGRVELTQLLKEKPEPLILKTIEPFSVLVLLSLPIRATVFPFCHPN